MSLRPNFMERIGRRQANLVFRSKLRIVHLDLAAANPHVAVRLWIGSFVQNFGIRQLNDTVRACSHILCIDAAFFGCLVSVNLNLSRRLDRRILQLDLAAPNLGIASIAHDFQTVRLHDIRRCRRILPCAVSMIFGSLSCLCNQLAIRRMELRTVKVDGRTFEVHVNPAICIRFHRTVERYLVALCSSGFRTRAFRTFLIRFLFSQNVQFRFIHSWCHHESHAIRHCDLA